MRRLNGSPPARRRSALARRLTAGCVATLPLLALAHTPTATNSARDWLQGSADPWVLGPLLVSCAAYALGCRRLLRVSRRGRALLLRRALSFAAGMAAIAVALCSPLDTLGSALFSAHMIQHEMLMIVAAPLAVLGRPLAVWLWAMPPPARTVLASLARARPVQASWRLATHALGAWLLHAIALWIWHVPRLFDAALASPAVHAAQHASFLGSALLYWRSNFDGAARPAHSAGAALSLFTTMVHTAALGALITLSPVPWYLPYTETSALFGLSALEDQQLGGLIMWVPAGLVYVAAALVLCARWLVRATPSHRRAP